MPIPAWVEGFPGSITVCDREGIILFMNVQAQNTFAAEGGAALIGKNLLDCHPVAARNKLIELMKNQQKNVYTIEKNGKKKLIYQAPWYEGEQYAGFMELSLVIPSEMQHFIRKG